MLPSQLAPFELVYLDQQGKEIPVKRNEDRVCFDNFTQLVEHLKVHPDFAVAGYVRVAVTFELLENSKTVLVGAMGYRSELNGASLKVSTFKVRGDLPDLRIQGWFFDLTEGA